MIALASRTDNDLVKVDHISFVEGCKNLPIFYASLDRLHAHTYVKVYFKIQCSNPVLKDMT
jgi:hypothetical protein